MKDLIRLIFAVGMVASWIWASDGAFKENEKDKKDKEEEKI